MDILGWIAWLLGKILGLAWTLVWFLLGGWVSTLAQIAVIVLVIYGLKYGWKRAPVELTSRTLAFGRFFWSWLRAKEPGQAAEARGRETVRIVRRKDLGDVALSSVLNVVLLAGFATLLAAL